MHCSDISNDKLDYTSLAAAGYHTRVDEYPYLSETARVDMLIRHNNGDYSDSQNCVPIHFTINGSPQGPRGRRGDIDVAFRCPSRASGHRGRHAKRSSGKMVRISICCWGPFPESPSQGFWEKYSSFASSASLRSSFPYFCKMNIFRTTTIDLCTISDIVAFHKIVSRFYVWYKKC